MEVFENWVCCQSRAVCCCKFSCFKSFAKKFILSRFLYDLKRWLKINFKQKLTSSLHCLMLQRKCLENSLKHTLQWEEFCGGTLNMFFISEGTLPLGDIREILILHLCGLRWKIFSGKGWSLLSNGGMCTKHQENLVKFLSSWLLLLFWQLALAGVAAVPQTQKHVFSDFISFNVFHFLLAYPMPCHGNS